ncbi:hypothetical protein DL93DRAFT_2154268 [Clavulina sp. PMI_390]|nr:hypothetical protein DL93DRAFT_2154268 [Clavulina sp. PMI_390]
MYDTGYLYVWFTFETVGGLIGMPILLLTLSLSSLKRLKTHYNLLLTWTVSAIISNMLFFAGRAFPSQPEPSYELCLLQSSMIYGVPVLLAAAALALIYETRMVITGKAGAMKSKMRSTLLLGAPWVAWLVVSITSLFVGQFASTELGRERRFFYCSFKNNALTDPIGIVTGLIVMLATWYTFQVGYRMYHSWQKMKDMVQNPEAAENAVGSAYVILRITLFGVDLSLALFLAFISLFMPETPLPDILAASMPFTVFLIFGTQQDVWMAWLAALRRIRDMIFRRNGSARPRPFIAIDSPAQSRPSSPDDEPPHSAEKEKPPQMPMSPAVSVINSFTVWKRTFLDTNMPPRSVWVDGDRSPPNGKALNQRLQNSSGDLEKIPVDFETSEDDDKPLPPLPMRIQLTSMGEEQKIERVQLPPGLV